MKYTQTTDSTTFTTKGWDKGEDGRFYKNFEKDVKPAFMKEVDQTLFSKEVKDLTGNFSEPCPNDYIKWLLATQIHYLVEVIKENESLEASKKKATFDLTILQNIKLRIEDCINYAILFNRYHNTEFIPSTSLAELKKKVVNLVESKEL